VEKDYMVFGLRHRVVEMTVYIHVLKEKKTKLEPSINKGNFVVYRDSHMEIDSEEHEALKDDHTDPSSLGVHPSDY
jgi:hypothetical protein